MASEVRHHLNVSKDHITNHDDPNGPPPSTPPRSHFSAIMSLSNPLRILSNIALPFRPVPSSIRSLTTTSPLRLSQRHLRLTDGQLTPLPPQPTPTTSATSTSKRIKTYPPPPSTAALIPNRSPINHLTTVQLQTLDPTGQRQGLFSRTSREAARVGDILLVRQKGGDPFAGVCLNIRRRGIDTAILLRNQLTRVGVEMWFKIFSPNVEGIELVKRREKRARRARLYYMRYVMLMMWLRVRFEEGG